jgi:hypothetical protein
MKRLEEFKRVVTGHDRRGRSWVVQAGAPPKAVRIEAVPGTVFHEIWKTHAMPVPVDNDATDPTDGALRLGPSRHGSAVRVVDIPPDSIQNAVSEQAAATLFAELGGGHGAPGDNQRHRLMHRTETLDYGIVVAGEVWLVLDQDELCLRTGDIVVQRGTNHAWSNRTEEMARMVFVLLDGAFCEELARARAMPA